MRPFLLCALLCALVSASASAAVPRSITIQGRLTDSSGVPLPAGAKGFLFRIFNAPVGGTEIWSGEDQVVQTNSEGLWTAQVGAIVGLTDAVFSDTVRWLDIYVNATQLPRVRLVTGPYAHRVSTVDGASGGTITSKVSIGGNHTNTGLDAFVAGNDNEVTGDYSNVGGGTNNIASGIESVIGGGNANEAVFYGTVIAGGELNHAGNMYSVIGGGSFNQSTGDHSVVGGGENNQARGWGTVVGGGTNNFADTSSAAVAGGRNNIASATDDFVGGGGSNVASGGGAAVLGGRSNQATGAGASVSGGYSNLASGSFSTLGGGQRNRARGQYATVSGGGGSQSADSNSALGNWSFIGGGHHNLASGDSSIVVGGTRNSANASGAVVVGGSDNHARGAFSFIGGGGGMFADSNSAHGDFSVAVGGNHAISRGDFSFVGGGYANRAYDDYTLVVGGYQNQAEGSYSTVVGGFSNWAGEGGSYKFIGGGRDNLVDASFASIIGGDSNTVAGSYGVAAGGRKNRAGALGSVCIGGVEDTVNALYGTTLGGYRNRVAALAKYSLAAGKRAKADHPGSFVWADSTDLDFISTGINQFLVRASGGVGIGTTAPEAPLHVYESSAGNITANTSSLAVFERSTTCYISILSPDASARGILFGEPSSTSAGGLIFNGSVTDGLDFRTGNSSRMTLDAVGNLTADGCISGTNIACPSDARFKRNVGTLSNALASVEKLRGVHYEWKSEDFPDRSFAKGEQVGLIAQEVREVVPQAVIEQSDGYLAVDYARLVPLLIEGMKEQQKQIDMQQNQIEQLIKRLEQ
jgi:hypothetical protein